jgi:hypothetical protein
MSKWYACNERDRRVGPGWYSFGEFGTFGAAVAYCREWRALAGFHSGGTLHIGRMGEVCQNTREWERMVAREEMLEIAASGDV